MKYLVVTRTPPSSEAGNQALDVGGWIEVEPPGPTNGYQGELVPLSSILGPLVLSLRRPVFHLGELLIVDDSGREITGAGRKPDKRDVSVDEFDSIDDALVRVREIADQDVPRPVDEPATQAPEVGHGLALRRAIWGCQILSTVPVEELQATFSHAHAVGPFVDPTAYRDALYSGSLRWQEELIRSIRPAIKAYAELVENAQQQRAGVGG